MMWFPHGVVSLLLLLTVGDLYSQLSAARHPSGTVAETTPLNMNSGERVPGCIIGVGA